MRMLIIIEQTLIMCVYLFMFIIIIIIISHNSVRYVCRPRRTKSLIKFFKNFSRLLQDFVQHFLQNYPAFSSALSLELFRIFFVCFSNLPTLLQFYSDFSSISPKFPRLLQCFLPNFSTKLQSSLPCF